jgi:hypothetical protein
MRFADKYGNDPKARNFFFGSHPSPLDRSIALNYTNDGSNPSGALHKN